MLFRVYEHYNDDYEPIIQDQYNDCVICFEYKTNFENKPTSLRKQILYFSNCNCDVAVHKNCLQIWLHKNKSCPICRNNIVVENNKILILQFVPSGIQIYSFVKHIYNITLFRFLLIFLSYHLLIYFNLLVLKTIYIPHNDTYNDIYNDTHNLTFISEEEKNF